MNSRFVLLAWLLLSCLCLSAAQYSRKELKEKWPEANTIIRSYKTLISFTRNPETKLIEVYQQDSIEMIPVNDGYIERVYFFDVNASVGECKLRLNGRNKRSMMKTIANYDGESVFHSDNKICLFKAVSLADDNYYLFTGEKSIQDIKFLTDVFFNDQLYPIVERTYTIQIPEWLELDIKEYNFDFFNVEKSDKNWEGGKQVIFKFADLDQLNTDKKGFLSLHHSYPHILFLPKSYNTVNGNRESIINDTRDLFDWYKKLLGDLTYNKEILGPVVKEITKDQTTDVDKIKAIYYWVQEHRRYVAFEEGLAGFRPEKAEGVYHKKYGDCKGMSNLLYAMLNIAGYHAKIAWLGAFNLRYNHATPSLAVDNHVICYLNFNHDDYFLDATIKLNPLNNNPISIQGKEIMINYDSTFVLKKIPEKDISENLKIRKSFYNISGTSLVGETSIEYNGDSKNHLMYSFRSIKRSDRNEFLEKVIIGDENTICDSIQTSEIDQRDSIFKIDFNEEVKNAVVSFGNETYVNLNSFNSFTMNDVDTTNCYHIFLNQKINSQSEITIPIPEDLEVLELPENTSYSVGAFSLVISYQQIGNQLICKHTVKINKAIIYKEDFSDFVDFNNHFKKIFTATIALKNKG